MTALILAAAPIAPSSAAAALLRSSASENPATGETYSIGPNKEGNPQCRFRGLPELVVEQVRGSTWVWGHYEAAAREPASKGSRYSVTLRQGTSPDGSWQGLGVSSRFYIQDQRLLGRTVKSAEYWVDDKKVPIPAYVTRDGRKPAEIGVGLTKMAHESLLVAAIGAGSTARVVLFDEGGAEILRTTYDVSSLRRAPAELSAAGWRCSA